MAPRIIDTSAGAVEIETFGTGTPILVIHGSPGGTDAARAMSRFLRKHTFQTICLSRPGYLGTPLHATNPSIDQEADLLAAVLDNLNIAQAGVLAWSGGGASAYRFAVRYPDRATSVVAVAAVSCRYVAPKPKMADKFLFGTAVGERVVSFLVKRKPEHVVETALKGEGTLRGEALRTLAKQVYADPQQRDLILETAQVMNIGGSRREGWWNDVANFAKIESLELERVQCPVFVVHGEGDTDLSVEHSHYAHSKLPNSTLVVMEQGTHLSFYAHLEAPDMQERARKWFLDHR